MGESADDGMKRKINGEKKMTDPDLEVAESGENGESNDTDEPNETDKAVVVVSKAAEMQLELMRVETEIVEEQLLKLEADEIAMMSFHQIDKDNPLWKHVKGQTWVFIETVSKPPYIVPKSGRLMSEAQLYKLFQLVPIWPSQFPDHLYEQVFDYKFQHKKNTPEGLRERTECFFHIREFFYLLEPLCNDRLQNQKRYKSNRIYVLPIDEDHDKRGHIIVSRKPFYKSGRKRINSLFADIYTAMRGHVHTQQKYYGEIEEKDIENKSELEKLEYLRLEIQKTIAQLQSWKSLQKDDKEKIEEIIDELGKLLDDDTNAYKAYASMQLDQSAKVKDKTGQTNPPAISARLVAAYNRLVARTEEVHNIIRFVDDDHRIMKRVKEKAENAFMFAHTNISSLLDDEFFQSLSSNPINQTNVSKDAARINRRLFNNSGNERSVPLHDIINNNSIPAPFPAWAEAVASNLEVASRINDMMVEDKIPKGLTLKKVHDAMCEYAIRAELALKYQRIHQTIYSKLNQILENPRNFDPKEMRETFESLRMELDPHVSGFPFKRREDIEFYEPQYANMSVYISEIIFLINFWDEDVNEVVAKLFNHPGSPKNANTGSKNDFETYLTLKDRIFEIEKKYLNQIYTLLKENEFKDAIKSITVDSLDVVDELVEKLELAA